MSDTAFIDGKEFSFETGDTILSFTRKNESKKDIPTLCYDDRMTPTGSCRLCSVEVAMDAEGPRKTIASCHTPVSPGIHIFTSSKKISKLRRGILELTCSNLPAESIKQQEGKQATEFTRLIASYPDVNTKRYAKVYSKEQPINDHPYLRFNPEACIDCFKCVEACDQIQGQFALNRHGRGFHGKILPGTRNQASFIESDCVSCGMCVQMCPTNALDDRHLSKSQSYSEEIKTTCTYCGVGCNLLVRRNHGNVVSISGDSSAEVNGGHTCVKGRYAFEYYKHPERLKTPLIKKDGAFVESTWDEAYNYIAKELTRIKESFGANSIGGLSSSRCTNEENYLLQKFIRAVIQTNNIDCCARVCHAPTAFGMQQTYGTGAATNSIEEIYATDCMLLVGANPTDAHPVTGAKIKQRALKGVPMIVVDPMKTELAKLADVHLQLKPGSNVALLNMFAHYLVKDNLCDQEFIKNRTTDFTGYSKKILAVDIAAMEEITGVKKELVQKAAHIFARADKAMTFHGLGVTEHFQGSKTVMLLASIVMLTGNIGKFGSGLNPLRGQNNVQGAADMGCQPHLGAGYMDVTKDEFIEHYETQYGRPVSPDVGLTTPEMLMGAVSGMTKALWIMGEDIMQSDPDTNFIEQALDSLEFIVVQELFMTETATKANVVLPASSHLEKEGTFTNGERRIQRVNRVLDPLPGTKSDGQMIVEMMNKMGYPQSDYDPKTLLVEISETIPFFAGVTWENLEGDGKQWPVQQGGADTKILHTEEFKIGRGRFKYFDYEMSPEKKEHLKQYPLILTTGRVLEQYNCGTMTRRTPNAKLSEKDILLMNQVDAHARGLENYQVVKITSARGSTNIHLKISDKVEPGVVYTTFHYPETQINKLTSCIVDIESKTPEYKVVAVEVERLN